MKQYKSHKEVPNKYKWDLSFLLEGKDLETRIQELFKDLKETLKTKDSKYDSPEAFLESLKLEDKISINATKISSYFSNSMALDITNSKIIDIREKFDFELNSFYQELGTDNFKFFENSAKIAKWAKLKSFKDYKYYLEFRLEEKPHQLSKNVEEFRILAARADISSSDFFETLCYSELDLGEAVSSKGKKIKITEANRSSLMKHSDKSIRRTTAEAYKKAHIRHKNSLASALYQHKKSEST